MSPSILFLREVQSIVRFSKCVKVLQTPWRSQPSSLGCRAIHVDSPPNVPELTTSYVHGTSSISLLGQTVGQTLQNAADRWPDREAVIFPQDGIRKTFAQFQQDVDQAAAGLLALGLKKGDRLAMCGPNIYEWILFQFATAKAGIILVAVNPAYQLHELEFALRKVECSAVVCPTKFKTQNYCDMLRQLCPEIETAAPGGLKSVRLPDLRVVIVTDSRQPGMYHMDDVMQAAGSQHRRELDVLQKKLSFDDPINIQFTSGTTGSPKGATLSHHNIVNNANFIGIRMGYNWRTEEEEYIPPASGQTRGSGAGRKSQTATRPKAGGVSGARKGKGGRGRGATRAAKVAAERAEQEKRLVECHRERMAATQPQVRLCLPIPMYHCSGLVEGGLTMAIHGITLVFPSTAYDSRANLAAIQNERCTFVYGTPTMFIDMLRQLELNKYDLSSLEAGSMGGSPCPAEIVKKAMTALNIKELVIGYGTTENSPATFQTYPLDNLERKTDTVGCIMYHTEAKVVDPSTGEIVPLGVSGELMIRGYCVMLEYWKDPSKTEECISKDGWFKTGDIAKLDEYGYCKIEGRIKDTIIRGGENIYPVEIEQFLHTHPKVHEVQVVGVPDERMGEEVCACIKLKEGQDCTTDEIKAYCKGQIAHFKIPRYVVFVEGYPLTVSGKIQKNKLRAEMEKSLRK